MSRLWSSGFELNTLGSEVEGIFNTGLGQIGTGTVRSGTYAYESDLPQAYINYQFAASAQTAPFFIRAYIRIATLPNAQDRIIIAGSSGLLRIGIRMNTDGTLELWNEEDSAQIGSDSSALSTNTWYRIELKVDTTTISSTSVEARIDGSSFASGTANLAAGILNFWIGKFNANVTGFLYYDDIAINDSTGSFQNSWPGEGEIIHLRPDEDGDNDAWGLNGFQQVDEITPDNATTAIQTNGLDDISEFTLAATPAALASDDTINCVQVGVRFRQDVTTGNDPTIALRIKSAPAGTVEESSAITCTTTTWGTNAVAAPRNYALTLYDLPGASTTAWTKADLDTAQIGVRLTNEPTDAEPQVSTMWLLVDHKPAGAETTTSTTTTSSSTTTSTSTSTTTTSSSTTTVSTTTSTTTSTSTTTTLPTTFRPSFKVTVTQVTFKMGRVGYN